MSHNIRNQLLQSVVAAQSYGESKHSATGGRSGQETGWKIYSSNYADDLRKLAKSFGTFLQTRFPDCKKVRDIQPQMITAYIADRSYKDTTMEKVASHMRKLEEVCDHRFGQCDWSLQSVSMPVKGTTPVRTLTATQVDYDRLLAAMQTGRSEAWRSLPLSRYAGCRVNEAAHLRLHALRTSGGRHGYGQVVLSRDDGTKGGRPRTVELPTAEARDALIRACAGVKPGEYIITSKGEPLKADSLTKSLKRGLERAGMDIEAWRQNGHHAFRKQFSQECYDLRRIAGSSKEEALAYVNEQLGHGRDRTDDNDTYVHNQW